MNVDIKADNAGFRASLHIVEYIDKSSPWPDYYVQTALDTSLDEIGKLRDLEEDWDGEGAVPISSKVITQAQAFVRLSANYSATSIWDAPDVAPTPNGGVRLLWHLQTANLRVIFDETSPDGLSIIDHPDGEPEFASSSYAAARVLRMAFDSSNKST